MFCILHLRWTFILHPSSNTIKKTFAFQWTIPKYIYIWIHHDVVSPQYDTTVMDMSIISKVHHWWICLSSPKYITYNDDSHQHSTSLMMMIHISIVHHWWWCLSSAKYITYNDELHQHSTSLIMMTHISIVHHWWCCLSSVWYNGDDNVQNDNTKKIFTNLK